MSKSTFEAAMASAGFNDSSTKISKTKLKAVMNEISDGIWGVSPDFYSKVEFADCTAADDVSNPGYVEFIRTGKHGLLNFCLLINITIDISMKVKSDIVQSSHVSDITVLIAEVKKMTISHYDIVFKDYFNVSNNAQVEAYNVIDVQILRFTAAPLSNEHGCMLNIIHTCLYYNDTLLRSKGLESLE